MPPRLVRREPLSERIRTAINPLDQEMAFSTWLGGIDWDGFQNSLATPMGLFLNITYFIARANSDGTGRRRGAGDVLRRSTVDRMDGWGAAISYSLWFLSWALVVGSLVNTVYCFTKKRRYRLFENNIEVEPQTPSARRVRVDSSPSNSPLRVISNLIEPLLDRPDARAHPTSARDVWEVAVWDPTPLSLRVFALFSPAHVAVYFLSFPIASSPSYHSSVIGYPAPPSTNPYATIFTVLVTQLLLSAQLIYISNAFRQQCKDTALIQKEVMHEYDTKFVAPRLNTLKRDVGMQTYDAETGTQASVDCYTPSFIRQGFKTAPNPNYSELTLQGQVSSFKRIPTTPSPSTYTTPLQTRPLRQPVFGTGNVRRTASSGTSMRDNGSGGGFDDTFRRETSYGGFDDTIRRETSYGHRSGMSRDGSLDDPSMSRSRDTGYASGGSSMNRSFDDPNDGPRMHRVNSNVGMHGLVNMSSQNSRSLSPSKMGSPLKRGSSMRESSYAGSLGGLGTPGRRREAW